MVQLWAFIIDYHGISVQDTVLFWFLGVFFYYLAHLFYEFSNRYEKLNYIANSFKAISYIVILQLCFIAFMVTYAPLSPFPYFDHIVNNWDLTLGFNVANFCQYFQHQQPETFSFFYYIYGTGLKIAIASYLILGITLFTKRFQKSLVLFALISVITLLIIFFFPILSPVSSYPDAKHCLVHFYDYVTPILKFRKTHLNPVNDDVSFPSYHVILILTVAYGLWSRFKWMNCLLVLMVILITLSTLVLGQHYLVDVLCSYLLFFVVWLIEAFRSKRIVL